MNTKRYQLEHYRKYLLNRVTASQHFTEYVENCIATEDDAARHSFHKIMIHNWIGNERNLFEALAEYFFPSFIPVNFTSQGAISSFYTCSLSLVLKITKLDFMFPHQRNMYNIDILFNDKTSADCFENRVTIEDIVTGVVSNRFSEKFDLDLTDFCNDPEFLEKKIHFYKLSLLSHYKILMLRMGRDTRSINLSNNNLTQVPTDILNFFIKGELIAMNFSNNEIPSLQELQRVSSKIEKLWLEGNPLCEDVDPMAYVKDITKKFPRLTELDGIKLNEHGFMLPFYRNYLVTPNKKTEMLVEKFLCLYFANYDMYPRHSVATFYAPGRNDVTLTLTTDFTDEQVLKDSSLAPYTSKAKPWAGGGGGGGGGGRRRGARAEARGRAGVAALLGALPPSEHDPTTFTVDVVAHDNKHLIIIVDGIYREKSEDKINTCKYFNFRRTFVLSVNVRSSTKTEYFIQNELFNVTFASKQLRERSFKCKTRSTNQLALHNPDPEDCDAITNMFSHITSLKLPEAKNRLQPHNYDMLRALTEFSEDLKRKKIPADAFIKFDEDDFSDCTLDSMEIG